MSFPSLLMRLLLSALLVLNGSVDAWAAVAGTPAHADGSTQPACAHAGAAAHGQGTVAGHAGSHAHHAIAQTPAADAAAQPDCDGGQACNHACHVHASSAAAIAALPTPVAFERGPALFPGNDFLRSATLSHQPIRPPIR
ncbi:CopL family metal-binding regulatory protein [Pseudoxanthomonas wuyuanensis]|uniref:CopL family metal-binding regulatory protein n=1 Tax=Pseudoxanthomonas wuyuanensis TaxID=1073196 RepID=A0A286DD60_9GAMM|nr:CopL family metal-binding regulatory protein [Pseudoxanthomonas wuyuanensis]KAF1720728.1 hypothetical protein CSC75_10155 [Pseudoxanthomonas wuyuanensis]SOD56563.1 hypothetical protein SAMN06296416_11053 [Pseudoxanthomonas wuyuanensis]